MGFGKWVLGGVCAVGAVVAAPVVLPTAGLATVVTSGVVGAAASSIYERQMEKARDEGRRDGNVSASKEYEEKYQKQEQIFKAKIKEYMDKINGLKEQLASYKEETELTEEEIRERDQYELELLEYIKKLEEELSGEDSSTTAWVSEYICDARNFVSAFG